MKFSTLQVYVKMSLLENSPSPNLDLMAVKFFKKKLMYYRVSATHFVLLYF